jgi:hypothetical protein
MGYHKVEIFFENHVWSVRQDYHLNKSKVFVLEKKSKKQVAFLFGKGKNQPMNAVLLYMRKMLQRKKKTKNQAEFLNKRSMQFLKMFTMRKGNSKKTVIEKVTQEKDTKIQKQKGKLAHYSVLKSM